MGKIKLIKLKKAPIFRKLAMGTWSTVGDPSVYGEIHIDMTKAISIMKKYSEINNVKITPTHLVAKALALALRETPEINGFIRGSRIYLRQSVSIFFQVNVPGQKGVKDANLSGVVIHEMEKKTLKEIGEHLNSKSQSVKAGNDLELKKSVSIMKLVPWCLTRYFLNLISFLIYGLNLDLSFLGLPKDPFGSAMITSVGGMGIDKGFAPLVPYSRVPLLFAIPTIKDQVVVENNEMCIRPILCICATFDHRIIDGVHGAHVCNLIRTYFQDPEKYLT